LVKIRKISVLLSECSVSALAETALWLLPEGLACAVGAKANVPFAGRHKIELKKMCGGENKKYRRVGNECRLFIEVFKRKYCTKLFHYRYFRKLSSGLLAFQTS
jgi:hypothetical protein